MAHPSMGGMGGMSVVAPASARKGASLDVGIYKVDDRELPSLCEAAKAGKLEYVSLKILEGGEADVIANSGDGGAAPIHCAASRGHVDVIDFLIEHGAGINDRSEGGLTPLMWLAKADNISHQVQRATAEALFARGADASLIDSEGKTAFTHGLHRPVAAHFMFMKGALPRQNDLTHCIKLKDMPAARYLLEQHSDNVSPNTTPQPPSDLEAPSPPVPRHPGDPTQPLEHALLTGDDCVVKMLLANGADPSLVDPAFLSERSASIKSSHISLLKEVQASGLPRGFSYEPSHANIWMLTGKSGRLLRFLGAAILPNCALLASAMFLPAVCGFVALALNLWGVQYVTTKSASSKTPEPGLAGWYTGGLLFGGSVLVMIAFPASDEENLKLVWWVVTSTMFACYLRALSCDPGVHIPTPEDRRKFFEQIGRGYSLEAIEGCPTTLCKKPLRSKFCSTSLKLIHRFDHYCVWTANSIGSGNHRPFFFFALLQLISQCLVLHFGLAFVKLDSVPLKQRTLCGYLDHLFSAEYAVASYFLICYNSAVILFITMVFTSQAWYVSRNVTSNEVWFPERYSWCFNIRRRTHTLFDKGHLGNWAEFLWGDLRGAGYVLPVLENNKHLMAIIAKDRAKMTSGADIQTSGCSHSHGGDGGGHGHSHSHGAPVAPAAVPPPAPPPQKPQVAEGGGGGGSGEASGADAAQKTAGASTNLVDEETGFIYPVQLKDHILRLPAATRRVMAEKQKAEFAKFNVMDESGKVGLPSEQDQSAFLTQSRLNQETSHYVAGPEQQQPPQASPAPAPVIVDQADPRYAGAGDERQGQITTATIRSASLSRGNAQLRSSTRTKAE